MGRVRVTSTIQHNGATEWDKYKVVMVLKNGKHFVFSRYVPFLSITLPKDDVENINKNKDSLDYCNGFLIKLAERLKAENLEKIQILKGKEKHQLKLISGNDGTLTMQLQPSQKFP